MFNWFKSFDKKYPYVIVVLLILIGSTLLYLRLADYIKRPTVIGVFIIGEGFYLLYKRFIKKDNKNNKENQISDEAAEAMASKIKFEAEQHRKNRDSHNYIRMASDEEEWTKPPYSCGFLFVKMMMGRFENR